MVTNAIIRVCVKEFLSPKEPLEAIYLLGFAVG